MSSLTILCFFVLANLLSLKDAISERLASPSAHLHFELGSIYMLDEKWNEALMEFAVAMR